MRQYTPIWIALKKDKVVSITTNRRFHPRIIKAVSKEKWMDIGYKIISDPLMAVLEHTSNGAVLTFRLILKPYPITARDLGIYPDIESVGALEDIAENTTVEDIVALQNQEQSGKESK